MPRAVALKTSVALSWHLGHSKVRSSRPSSIGVTTINSICVAHCRHAGANRAWLSASCMTERVIAQRLFRLYGELLRGKLRG